MNKAHIAQHQLRAAVASQTQKNPDGPRGTSPKAATKVPKAKPKLKSTDKKIVKGQIRD